MNALYDVNSMLLVLAAMVAGLLLWIMFAWHSAQTENNRLPIWGFMKRFGITRNVFQAGTLEAELRCTLCASRSECRERVRTGEPIVADCPNGRFFDQVRR